VPEGPAAAAAPEPATGAMMLLGFAGMGFVATARRKATPSVMGPEAGR
jgi:hypothetical protein